MKRWFTMAALLTLLMAFGAAQGDDKPAKGKGKAGLFGEEAFKKMDANGDGKISLEEFKKAVEARGQGKLKDNPEMIEKMFNRMDADGDGFISAEEFKKAREQMAERMKNGKGKKKPGDDKKPEAEKKPEDK